MTVFEINSVLDLQAINRYNETIQQGTHLMDDQNTLSLSCPNCSAPLEVVGSPSTVRCAYCGSLVALIGATRPAAPQPDPLVPDLSLSEVAALFRAGKRVQATIRYREITGAGLKDAQTAIDRFAAGEPLRRPNLMGRK